MSKEKGESHDESGVEENFNPIEDIINFIKTHQQEGDLPIILLSIVVIYNFIFYQTEPGYVLYIYGPAFLLVIGYFINYWQSQDIRIYLSGTLLILVAAVIDLTVSISYIFGTEGSYRGRSLPTLFLDLGVLFSIGTLLSKFNPEQFSTIENETSLSQK